MHAQTLEWHWIYFSSWQNTVCGFVETSAHYTYIHIQKRINTEYFASYMKEACALKSELRGWEMLLYEL